MNTVARTGVSGVRGRHRAGPTGRPGAGAAVRERGRNSLLSFWFLTGVSMARDGAGYVALDLDCRRFSMADPPARPITVLLVEDDPGLLEALAFALGMGGYDVLKAADADAALVVTRRCGRPIDIVVTDVVLPGMSGVELVRTLSADRPSLKSLYMSGYPCEVLREHGLEDAGDRFLSKPFSLDRLEEKIEACVRPQVHRPGN